MISIGEMARDMKDIDVDPSNYLLKVFLAGDSGSGKTQGMTTLPGRKLFIDLDGRSQTLAGQENVSVIEIIESDPKSPRAWMALLDIQKQIVAEVKKDIFPYHSIIYDGLTMLGRASMNWALLLDPKRGLGGAPAQQHYLPQMDALGKFVLSALTIPRHIGFTGHLELHEEEGGPLRFYPKITGKLRTEVPNWFNETYLCYRTKEGKGTSYRWLTAGSGRDVFFKSSLNALGKYWDDPIEIDFSKERVGFMDLLHRRFGDAWKDPLKGGDKSEPDEAA